MQGGASPGSTGGWEKEVPLTDTARTCVPLSFQDALGTLTARGCDSKLLERALSQTDPAEMARWIRWIKEPAAKLDHFQNPCGGRREPTPTSCPDFHMQAITCTHVHTHACHLKVKGSEREKTGWQGETAAKVLQKYCKQHEQKGSPGQSPSLRRRWTLAPLNHWAPDFNNG